jgi:hypothetical protein
VVVRQATGAGAQLEACEFCARALRRLAATTAGVVRFVDGGPGPRVTSQPVARIGEPLPAVPLGEAFLEYPHPWRGPDGVAYQVRACGATRADGTWTGWLEFWAPEGTVWRTPRETTQPNRGALEYWASGLQPTYFEGALARARPLVPPQGPV